MESLQVSLLSIWDCIKYFIRYGEISSVVFSIFPVTAALASMFSGIRLLRKLRPGMVCRASLGCNRCELLYIIGLGSATLPAVYLIMELKWLLSENYLKISSLDDMLWSSWEAAILFFLAWASYRSLHCLDAHCSFDPFPVCRGRNHSRR